MMDWITSFSDQVNAITASFVIINAIIHIIFSGAVARDAGNLRKRGKETILVSGLTWAFATLAGGVFVAVIYWLLHHLKITNQR